MSCFVVDKKDLTKSDVLTILLYCAHTDNKDEKWEIEISNKYNWISGTAMGKDTGKFWEFLIKSKLDNKIEIVRG
jgi:hypothetical protein